MLGSCLRNEKQTKITILSAQSTHILLASTSPATPPIHCVLQRIIHTRHVNITHELALGTPERRGIVRWWRMENGEQRIYQHTHTHTHA